MNTNIVILCGNIIQPIQPTKYFLTITLECKEDEICIEIPYERYQLMSETAKETLNHAGAWVQIDGYIINAGRKNTHIMSQRVVAEHVRKRSRSDFVNLVVVAGVICAVDRQRNEIQVGILEGRQMSIVSGIVSDGAMMDSLKKFQTVEFVGYINKSEAIFTGYKRIP